MDIHKLLYPCFIPRLQVSYRFVLSTCHTLHITVSTVGFRSTIHIRLFRSLIAIIILHLTVLTVILLVTVFSPFITMQSTPMGLAQRSLCPALPNSWLTCCAVGL